MAKAAHIRAVDRHAARPSCSTHSSANMGCLTSTPRSRISSMAGHVYGWYMRRLCSGRGANAAQAVDAALRSAIHFLHSRQHERGRRDGLQGARIQYFRPHIHVMLPHLGILDAEGPVHRGRIRVCRKWRGSIAASFIRGDSAVVASSVWFAGRDRDDIATLRYLGGCAFNKDIEAGRISARS